MRGTLAVLALLAALGVPRAAGGESKYAVLASDATLLTSTKRDATKFQVGASSSSGVGYEVEVLASKGEFYKVRTLADSRCHRNLEKIADLELVMYVAKTDVHRVLTEALSLDLGDGQRLEARPGAIVYEKALHAERFSVSVGLPEAAIGRTFRREPAIVGRTRNADLAAHRWTVGDITIESRGGVDVFHDTAGGANIVTMLSPCLTASVPLSAGERELVARSRHGFGSLVGREHVETLTLAKGTRLRWPGGGVAGVVRRRFELSSSKLNKKVRCFERGLGEGSRVTLCAKKNAFKRSKPTDRWGGLLGAGKISVAFGRTSVSAGLKRAEVSKVIRGARGGMLRCFRRAQTRTRPIVGTSRLELVFKVTQNGRSKVVKAASKNGSKFLARCVERVAKGLRFPQPTTAIATIAQTIRFIP